jgi:predicted aldo/keto reductase-like oxidoreductase
MPTLRDLRPDTPTMHPHFHSTHLTARNAAAPLCRLGLASRGESELTPADIRHALDHGVNFLNWCGHPDGLSAAVTKLGPRREQVLICVQLEARRGADAERELGRILRELNTEYVDVLTFYYVEEACEWDEIREAGGALDVCEAARRAGQVRWLGLTSHQRPLAADVVRSGALDLVMVRYNAAHRGAEDELFPIAAARGLPVLVYTCLN